MRNRKGLEEGDASSPLLLHFDTEHVVRKVQANNEGIKQHSTHQLLLHGDAMNLLGVCEHSLLRGEKTKERERERERERGAIYFTRSHKLFRKCVFRARTVGSLRA